jgi:hypothetical protein
MQPCPFRAFSATSSIRGRVRNSKKKSKDGDGEKSLITYFASGGTGDVSVPEPPEPPKDKKSKGEKQPKKTKHEKIAGHEEAKRLKR